MRGRVAEGVEAGLEATTFYYPPPNFVFPYGAHVAVVDVHADTGAINLKRHVALDDCGPQINPVIVEGQIHGCVVQGIGQALWEEAVYDEDGKLVSGSMLDYALPTKRGRCCIPSTDSWGLGACTSPPPTRSVRRVRRSGSC